MRTLIAILRSYAPLLSYDYKGTSVVCNLCASTESRLICETDRRLKRLRTVTCDNCGLMRTDPMPSEAELRDYYASSYRLDYQFTFVRQPPRFHLNRSHREAQQRFATLAPLLKKRSRVLDLGAGSGEFLALAAASDHEVRGIEPGVAFAEFARRRYGVRVDCHGWQDADYPVGSFDLISARHVLEHLREPVSALRRMSEWLAEGGIIFVSVPNILSGKKYSFQKFHFAHVYNFTPQSPSRRLLSPMNPL